MIIAVVYTTGLVISLMVGTVVVTAGTTAYCMKSKPQNPEDAAELEKLRKESLERQQRIHQATKHLVDNTAGARRAIASTTIELHQHINDSARAFDKEIELTKGANLQLMEIATLLQQISESTSSQAQPLIEEIKRRLDEIDVTNQTLVATTASLTKTARMLEAAVAEHAATQKHLEGIVQEDGLTIKSLSLQLLEAQHKLQPDGDEIQLREVALCSAKNENQKLFSAIVAFNSQLTQLMSELETMTTARQAQAVKMRELLDMNTRLGRRVSQLSLKLEGKDVEIPLSCSPSVTLFGNTRVF